MHQLMDMLVAILVAMRFSISFRDLVMGTAANSNSRKTGITNFNCLAQEIAICEA